MAFKKPALHTAFQERAQYNIFLAKLTGLSVRGRESVVSTE
jgi:hypothetical protein